MISKPSSKFDQRWRIFLMIYINKGFVVSTMITALISLQVATMMVGKKFTLYWSTQYFQTSEGWHSPTAPLLSANKNTFSLLGNHCKGPIKHQSSYIRPPSKITLDYLLTFFHVELPRLDTHIHLQIPCVSAGQIIILVKLTQFPQLLTA